jgi:hypothetical protein
MFQVEVACLGVVYGEANEGGEVHGVGELQFMITAISAVLAYEFVRFLTYGFACFVTDMVATSYLWVVATRSVHSTGTSFFAHGVV